MRHNKLAPALEEFGQGLQSIRAIEEIVFLDLDPQQPAALAINLVTFTG